MKSSNLARWSLAAMVGLAGCGAIYTSPKVSDGKSGFGLFGETNYDVRVVPLSFETALEANLASYTPARLPAFFNVGGAGSGAAMGGAPVGVTARESSPRPPVTNLPPQTEPTPYRMGVADVLLLSANTAEATLTDLPGLISAQSKRQGYIVQDDGAIAIPDVGRVRVGGLTLEEAEARIFDALVEKRFDPTFSLEIAEFNSQRVSIGGSVGSAVVTPITLKPLYLHEALQLASGVQTPDADFTTIRLYRDGGVYQIPLNEFYSNRGMRNIVLKDGDSVIVDAGYEAEQARSYFDERLSLFEASISANAAQRNAFKDRIELGAVERGHVYLAGEVKRAHRYPLPFENRAYLADVLYEKEGINIREGDYSEIYILRSATRPEEAGGVTAYHLNAANAANLAVAAQMEMRPGDVVFVAEHPVTAWNRTISQITPTIFIQAAGLTGL